MLDDPQISPMHVHGADEERAPAVTIVPRSVTAERKPVVDA